MAKDFGPGLPGKMGIDTMTGAALTMGIGHFKAHFGTHYFFSDHITIQDGGTALIIVSVPPLVFPHFTFLVESTGMLAVDIFENATNISGGTPITPFNNNRNSSTVSGLAIKMNPAANMGDCLGRFKWGASGLGVHPGIGGQALIGDKKTELILKPGTAYAWRMVSGEMMGNNIIGYKAAWHE